MNDLSPLREMPLEKLFCNDTKVSDLSPIARMPLTELWCDNLSEYRHILASIETLKLINGVPTDDFWANESAGVSSTEN